MSISKADIKKFIDDLLSSMEQRPGMYGTRAADIEGQCSVLLHMFCTFCTDEKPCLDWGDPYGSFNSYAKKLMPKKPGPQSIADYLVHTKGLSESDASESVAHFYRNYIATFEEMSLSPDRVTDIITASIGDTHPDDLDTTGTGQLIVKTGIFRWKDGTYHQEAEE